MNDVPGRAGEAPAPWVVLDEWHLGVLAPAATRPEDAEALRDVVRFGLASLLQDLTAQHVTVSLG